MGAALNDCQETFSFFMKLSSFARYQLDDVLPKLLSKSDFDIPEEVTEECELLLLSMRTFLKLIKVVKREFAPQIVPPKAVESWENMLLEMMKSELPGKGQYCGLCDFYTFNPEQWNTHVSSDKKHFEINQQLSVEGIAADESFCKICGIVLFSEKPHLDIILSSKSHVSLDTAIKEKAMSHLSTDMYFNNKPTREPVLLLKMKSSVKPTFRKYSPSLNKQSNKPGNQKKPVREPSVKNAQHLSKNANHKSNPDKIGGPSIANNFKSLCEAISVKKRTDGYYCFPCNLIFDRKLDWLEHNSTVFHPGKNISETCQNCDFGIFIFKKRAGDYWAFHNKICHPSGDPASFKPTPTKPPSPAIKETVNDPNLHLDLLPKNEIIANGTSSDMFDANIAVNQKLLDILAEQKRCWESKTDLCFNGVCLKCDSTITSFFEWSTHCSDHGDAQSFECNLCNIGICGDKKIIGEYVAHPEHVKLDECLVNP